MNPGDLDTVMAFAADIVTEAGHIALRYFRQSIAVDNKLDGGRFDPVTIADREVETFLRARIAERFPDHGIIGEEHAERAGNSRYSWIIDPIDGTRAFISGVPAWGILLGLREDAHCIGGLMHQPYLQETFCGTAGNGWFAHRGERRVLCARRDARIENAILYCTHPDLFATPAARQAFERVAARCRLVRFGGDCYSYCLLALGHIDLVIEDTLQPYDIQPLIPIIEAAGGIVTNRDGGDAQNGGFVVAAANRELHQQVLQVLNASP